MSEYILFQPNDKKVYLKSGSTILNLAITNGVHIRHRCGGKGSCLTCKVNIDHHENVTKPTKKELIKLGSNAIKSGIRLSCQTKAMKSVTVSIPQDPLKAVIKRLQAENEENDSL